MANGLKGFQPGNTEARKKGKHKKTIQKEKEIEYIQDRIRKELEPIINALILKCKAKDLPAIKEALDRLIGKPKQEIEGNINLYKLNIIRDGEDNKGGGAQ